jgi:8-oxo-dGTP pyrophosphatase MutT (NUDIX family)
MKKPAPARDAAAVLLHVLEEEPRVLWVRRAPAQPFLGGFYSLPGGGLSVADAGAPATGGSEVALRVAALRELFEETGVLLVEPAADEALRDALREAYAPSAAEGHARLARRGGGCAPPPRAGGALVTPAVSDRFDARFYALGLRPRAAGGPPGPSRSIAPVGDAADALARWSRAMVLIAPPALAMLKVLAATPVDAARDRGARAKARGGICEVIPGVRAFPDSDAPPRPTSRTWSGPGGRADQALAVPERSAGGALSRREREADRRAIGRRTTIRITSGWAALPRAHLGDASPPGLRHRRRSGLARRTDRARRETR